MKTKHGSPEAKQTWGKHIFISCYSFILPISVRENYKQINTNNFNMRHWCDLMHSRRSDKYLEEHWWCLCFVTICRDDFYQLNNEWRFWRNAWYYFFKNARNMFISEVYIFEQHVYMASTFFPNWHVDQRFSPTVTLNMLNAQLIW